MTRLNAVESSFIHLMMVRQIEHLLRELGWADGFHIPVANDENKAVEEQVILTSYLFSLIYLVYLFIHLVPHVTLETSISVYSLCITKHNL